VRVHTNPLSPTTPTPSDPQGLERQQQFDAKYRLTAARRAAASWREIPLDERAAMMRDLRHTVADHVDTFTRATRGLPDRTPALTLSAELLPLCAACRFLERVGPRLLKPRRLGRRGRPLWLSGEKGSVVREPWGVVLIVAPSNYPLLLPGVQALQALFAGNAVLVKPGPGGRDAMNALNDMTHLAGFDPNLLQVLGEAPDHARAVMNVGVDRAVFTGAVQTGRTVYAQAAQKLTPVTLELSGCDASFVLDDADVQLAAAAIAFGATLNGGRTCLAPRRVFAEGAVSPVLRDSLRVRLQDAPPVRVSRQQAVALSAMVREALQHGARLLCGDIVDQGDRAVASEATGATLPLKPVLLDQVRPEMTIARSDVFLPVVSLMATATIEQALQWSRQCPYALGATIFCRREARGRRLALRVPAGSVVVNDAIVPTADPRTPFGGGRASGFGVTRGREGLLEMTRPRTIHVRGGRRRPHLEPEQPEDAELFKAWIEAAHGLSWTRRARALGRLVQTALRRGRT